MPSEIMMQYTTASYESVRKYVKLFTKLGRLWNCRTKRKDKLRIAKYFIYSVIRFNVVIDFHCKKRLVCFS